MSKRMMIALFLSLMVVMVFQLVQGPPPPSEKKKESVVEKSDTVPQSADDTPAEKITQAPDQVASEQSSDLEVDSTENVEPKEESSAETVIETGTSDTVPFDVAGLRGHFSRQGARLDSIKTKGYERIGDRGGLYDLVHKSGQGLAFELRYPDLKLNQQMFDLVQTNDTRTFEFVTTTNGLQIRKRYRFSKQQKYRASFAVSVKNISSGSLELNNLDFPANSGQNMGLSLRWGPGFGVGRQEKTQFDNVYWYYGKNGEMNYFAPQGAGGFYKMIPFIGSGGGDKPYQVKSGPVEWSAVSNRYFIAAAIPEKPFNNVFLKKGDKNDSFTTWANYDETTLDRGEKKEFEFELFLGPKFYNTLQEFHSGLESTLNYGWFTLLTYPLLISLRWIFAVIPNYGIAIIILSVAIKFLLYPLTKKGLVSMRKMKELQPKMKEIQDKYSDDREKMNEKLMEFYQEHNVNPLGGCLPMLLQLPIFIALYRMLEYSIELRGAYFALWVTDLSAKDPYYILPVLMGILMFFQQWYTMSSTTGGAMGQQQQMMMYVMPVFMTFIFMNFPVGLVLYWMTNSASTLVQYWMINRSMEES